MVELLHKIFKKKAQHIFVLNGCEIWDQYRTNLYLKTMEYTNDWKLVLEDGQVIFTSSYDEVKKYRTITQTIEYVALRRELLSEQDMRKYRNLRRKMDKGLEW